MPPFEINVPTRFVVPVEAMYMKTPVVAVNSGGPLETVVHGVTGYLSEPDAQNFARHLGNLLRQETPEFGENGRKRVNDNFSFGAFANKLNFFISES